VTKAFAEMHTIKGIYEDIRLLIKDVKNKVKAFLSKAKCAQKLVDKKKSKCVSQSLCDSNYEIHESVLLLRLTCKTFVEIKEILDRTNDRAKSIKKASDQSDIQMMVDAVGKVYDEAYVEAQKSVDESAEQCNRNNSALKDVDTNLRDAAGCDKKCYSISKKQNKNVSNECKH